MPDLNQIDTNIQLLEKDISIHTKLFEKIEQSLAKNQEVVTNIAQLLKIHDLKFDEQDKINTDIYQEMDKTKVTHTEEFRALIKKVDDLAIAVAAINQSRRKTDKDGSDKEEEGQGRSVLSDLKKWRNVLIGMILVISYIMNKISWEKLLEVMK
jgi:septal ring factor EnvC (AmiA/AmiB activator)